MNSLILMFLGDLEVMDHLQDTFPVDLDLDHLSPEQFHGSAGIHLPLHFEAGLQWVTCGTPAEFSCNVT